MQKNTTSLDNRIRNAKKFKFTDQLAVRKVLENVVKIPFADFMFLYPRIYQDVMADMLTSFRKGACPNFTTGKVCTFVSKQYACYPNDRATRQLIDEMEKPYSAVNSFLDKEPIRADVKNSEATWNYVKEKKYPIKMVHGEDRIPLEVRINEIKRSAEYKKQTFEQQAYLGIIPNEYGKRWMYLLAGTEIQKVCEAIEEIIGADTCSLRKLCQLYAKAEDFDMHMSIMSFYDAYQMEMDYNEKMLLMVEPLTEIYRAVRSLEKDVA